MIIMITMIIMTNDHLYILLLFESLFIFLFEPLSMVNFFQRRKNQSQSIVKWIKNHFCHYRSIVLLFESLSLFLIWVTFLFFNGWKIISVIIDPLSSYLSHFPECPPSGKVCVVIWELSRIENIFNFRTKTFQQISPSSSPTQTCVNYTDLDKMSRADHNFCETEAWWQTCDCIYHEMMVKSRFKSSVF